MSRTRLLLLALLLAGAVGVTAQVTLDQAHQQLACAQAQSLVGMLCTPTPPNPPQPTPGPGPGPTPPSGSLILDLFTSTRLNGDTPPVPLFSPYGGASFPEGAGQVATIGSGTLTLTVVNGMYLQFTPYPYVDPLGFAHGRTMAGTWAQVNRLVMHFTPPKSIAANVPSSGIFQWGTYSKDVSNTSPSDQGDHYYHFVNTGLTARERTTCIMNNVPQHRVGTTGFTDPNPTFPANPTMITGPYGGSGIPLHSGPNHDYFYGLTRFYFADQYANGLAGAWTFEPFTFTYVTGEPDTQVSTLCVHYTGTAYELGWQGGRNVVWTYNIYQLKTDGTLGAVLGTAKTRGDSYTAVDFITPAMPRDNTIGFGIQPQGGTAYSSIYPGR